MRGHEGEESPQKNLSAAMALYLSQGVLEYRQSNTFKIRFVRIARGRQTDGASPPMHMNLPGNQNRPSRAPRAHSPGRIALYPGHAPFWARRDVLVGTLACVLDEFGPSPHAANPVVYRSGILGRTVLAPRRWPRALKRERCSGRIGASRRRGAVPADPDVLWC